MSLSARFGAFDVELHLAAEKAVGGEPAEHEIGVGDGRLFAAEPVADRTRHRAGAFRSDAQRAGETDARDAAAAGADFLDVDHRHLHRKAGGIAADQRTAGHQHMAVVDDAGFRRGAAHVEGDGIIESHAVAQDLGADDARGRTRFQHADAGIARFVDVEQAAGRLHDQERAVEIRFAQMRVHHREIIAHARADIGIGGDGRGALELAIFLRQFMRRRDEQAGAISCTISFARCSCGGLR